MSEKSLYEGNQKPILGKYEKTSFVIGVVDVGGKPLLSNISVNFRKSSKRPPLYTKGSGKTDSCKKTEVENPVSDSL